MTPQSQTDNPWIGLKSYAEGIPLYGRDEEIDSLTSRILYHVQTVVYGRSGIGKSSILNAGIFPRLRQHGILPVHIRLEHNDKPYTDQVVEAIEAALKERHFQKTELVERHTDAQNRPLFPQTLWEYFHRMAFADQEGREIIPLVVLDQFEEIFTLEKDHRKVNAFFVELADLLNHTKPALLQQLEEKLYVESGTTADAPQAAPDLPPAGRSGKISTLLKGRNRHRTSRPYVEEDRFHLVITIREDYLSHLERHTTHIPLLKQNRYCLQPINEEQAAQIILRPRPGLIDSETARLIIEKVTDEHDFSLDGTPEIQVDSAVLSLYLSRLFEKKAPEDSQITPLLIEKFGDNIIENFYADSMADYPPKVVAFLEDNLLNDENHRENISVYNARRMCPELTRQMIDRMADEQKIIRKFSYNGTLRIEFIHDILCPVVQARKEHREQLRRQEEERRQQEAEKQRILQEEERKRRELERQSAEEKARMQAEARRTRRRNRRILSTVLSVLLLLVVTGGGYWWLFVMERVAYYADFERVDGWPEGVGPELKAEQRNSTPLYYRLSHRGHLDHHTDVEVLSSNGRLPLSPRLDVMQTGAGSPDDALAQAYANLLSRVQRIRFVEDENGRIDKEVLVADNDSTLFIVRYFHLANGKEAWAHFITTTGQSMPIRDNQIDRIKLSWNRPPRPDMPAGPDDGRLESMMFFDALGVRRPIDEGTCGYLWRYRGPAVARYALDEYYRTQQSACNVVITRRQADTLDIGYACAASLADTLPRAAAGPEGYARIVRTPGRVALYDPGKKQPAIVCLLTHDERGNLTQTRLNGTPARPYPALVRQTYDPHTGYLTQTERLDAQEQPFATDTDSIYKKQWSYDPQGRLCLELHLDARGQRAYYRRIHRRAGLVADTLMDRARHIGLVRIDSLRPNGQTTTFYDLAGRPLNHLPVTPGGKDTLVCRQVTRKAHGVTSIAYYTCNADGRIVPCPKKTDWWGTATSYFRKEEARDASGNLTYYQLFDESGAVIKSMMYFYQYGEIIGRAVMGIDHTPVRCPLWEEEGFAYYKLYYNKDFNGSYVNITAVDETEHPSVFYDPTEKTYRSVSYRNFKGNKVILKDYSSVHIMKDYYQYVFDVATDISNCRVPYLHVLSRESALYEAGLRDGDRLVRLGSWTLGQADHLLQSEWQKCLSQPQTVRVLRPSDQGFAEIETKITRKNEGLEEYHILALSTEELNLFQPYLKKD